MKKIDLKISENLQGSLKQELFDTKIEFLINNMNARKMLLNFSRVRNELEQYKFFMDMLFE